MSIRFERSARDTLNHGRETHYFAKNESGETLGFVYKHGGFNFWLCYAFGNHIAHPDHTPNLKSAKAFLAAVLENRAI
jgi:hypothetical protein